MYKNTTSLEVFTRAILHKYSSKFILVAWYIPECWYIPLIIDENMYNLQTTYYVDEEPTIHNLPKPHTKLANLQTVNDDKVILIIDTPLNISEEDASIMLAFVLKCRFEDVEQRIKTRVELTLTNVCYNLRTSLNSILNMSILVMQENRDETLKANLNTILNSSKTLAVNLFDIIDIVQLEVSKLKINKEIVYVKDLIYEIVEIVNRTYVKPGVSFEYFIDPIVPDYAYLDVKRCKQILINLLENAFRFTHKGYVALKVDATLINLSEESETEFSVDAQQYQITFQVSDTGCGIDKQTIPTIFKPIEMQDPDKQHGIGLRISYLLANKLNGDLRLKNTEVGKGSCFEFSLVVYEEEPPTIDRDTLIRLKSKKVLILDSTNDRIQVCQVLKTLDISYTVVSSYDEIKILYWEVHYDLCIIKCTKDVLYHVKELKKEWSTTLFIGLHEPLTEIPPNIFNELIEIPAETSKYSNTIITVFNTDYTNVRVKSVLCYEPDQNNAAVIEKLLRPKGGLCLVSTTAELLKMLHDNDFYTTVILDTYGVSTNIVRQIRAKSNGAKIVGLATEVLERELTALFDQVLYKPINYANYTL
jgi:signal transduction histidine kinase